MNIQIYKYNEDDEMKKNQINHFNNNNKEKNNNKKNLKQILINMELIKKYSSE